MVQAQNDRKKRMKKDDKSHLEVLYTLQVLLNSCPAFISSLTTYASASLALLSKRRPHSSASKLDNRRGSASSL